MNNVTIFLIGGGVFSLLLIGLYLTATEFLKVSTRPDRLKGDNVTAFRRIDQNKAA